MRLEIERNESGYVLRSGNNHQHHPTFIDLMRSILETFHDTSETEPEHIGKEALVETTKKLIDYLFLLNFSPSNIIDVLHHLQEAVQHNFNDRQSQERTVQLRLINEWLVEAAEFTEAQPFSTRLLIPQCIGKSIVRNHNGSIAIQRRGFGGTTVFIKKQDLEKLMAQSKRKNHKLLSSAGIPATKRSVIVECVEDLKDDKLGMFPMVKATTHIASDAGEINAKGFERGSW